jgi:threonylcarbamoyladenosine tRNA methylthiotransferase MtaB
MLSYNTTVSSFYVESFGCRATQADGAVIERELLGRGLTAAENAGQAQVVILNTCTVTAAADQDVRAAIRRIHRSNPNCRILVTGCYAQRAPQELAAIPGVSVVVGNSHKHQVAEIAASAPASNFVPLAGLKDANASGTAEIYVGDIFAHTELSAATVFESGVKTRPNLKLQDGCNNRCSFCIIPSVRGRSRSLPLQEAIREVNTLVESGYREVVISGINLGRWGRDLPGRYRFQDLLKAILERTALEKLRISSVEPMDWSEEVIALVAASPRIAKHAHVPMQSGSDRVLRQMHRKYRPWHYADRVRKIRAAMPAAAIGADVMVGFPGETELDFEQTYALVEQLPLTYLHVFTYSSRPGTPSALMPAQVPPAVMKERNRLLRNLAARKKQSFMESFVGETIQAITLSVYENGFTEALTDNYLKLHVAGKHAANQWLNVQVERAGEGCLFGRVPGVAQNRMDS